MQFIYCPNCRQMQPKKWYSSKRCAVCFGEANVIKVKPTIYGNLSTACSIIALILILIYLFDYETFLGDGIVYVFLLLLVTSFALMFVELGRAKRTAETMVKNQSK
jgi:hypothetical protein